MASLIDEIVQTLKNNGFLVAFTHIGRGITRDRRQKINRYEIRITLAKALGVIGGWDLTVVVQIDDTNYKFITVDYYSYRDNDTTVHFDNFTLNYNSKTLKISVYSIEPFVEWFSNEKAIYRLADSIRIFGSKAFLRAVLRPLVI